MNMKIFVLLILTALPVANPDTLDDKISGIIRIVGAGDYNTINEAIAASVAGDAIRIKAGTYSEQVLVNKAVTIEPFGDGPVWVSADCTRLYGIYVTAGGTGATIKGIGIKLANEAGIRIDDASDVRLDSLIIQDYNCVNANVHLAAGIAVREATRITVINNAITRRVKLSGPQKGQGNALWFKNTGSDRGGGHLIANNLIIGGWDGLGGEGENSNIGILHKDSIVENNVFKDCDDDGIQVEGGTQNVYVRNNTIEGCAIGIAFAPSNVGPLYIERNRVLNLEPGYYGSTNGIKTGDGGSGTVYITENEFRTNAAASCIAQTNSGLGMTFISRGNIYQCDRYIFEFKDVPSSGSSLNYDCMWSTDSSRFVKWGGTLYGNLASFQTATGQELNGNQTQNCSPIPTTPTTATTSTTTTSTTITSTTSTETTSTTSSTSTTSTNTQCTNQLTSACQDDDNDGVLDFNDNCPNKSNPDQKDRDRDGIGDECDNCVKRKNHRQQDSDRDGIGDVCDNCINAFNPYQNDSDKDRIGDACDNCVNRYNRDQKDSDGDGIGDRCDNCRRVYNLFQINSDSDGFGDACDKCPTKTSNSQIDRDKDSIGDACDNCRYNFNPDQKDFDDDGIGDACDKKPQQFTCCIDNECFQSTIDSCRDQGGAVMQCVPPKIADRVKPGANITLNQTNTSSEFARNVTRDANNTGIPGKKYNATSYDCDDFADDMERNLTALGYNATFTVYWCYNSAGATTTAHAITDVHAPDGTIIFIEPQRARIVNLDFDGDGVVEYRTHHSEPRQDTDDRCEIEVYDSKAAAVAAGVNMD